jgi:uncharacterized Rossmann fold enzyme
MEFETWEPYYLEILDYFGFDRKEDERAAEVLASLLQRDDLPLLECLCRERIVTVCGNAPCLIHEMDLISGSVFAADAACLILNEAGIRPDAIFTDLDGATDDYLDLNREGTLLVIHAHGDNIPLLSYWTRRFDGPVMGTTQARPFPPLHNFGGFTDGDRPVFAAHHLGADQVILVGFDLDDDRVDPLKRGKLRCARKLLALLGHAC